MTHLSLFIGLTSIAIWSYLFFARGMFWRLRAFDDDSATVPSSESWPRVRAVVPARNEAATIGNAVASLLAQDYPGEFSVVLVDDHSSDGTADVARRIAAAHPRSDRLTIRSAARLASGWTGKLWALNEGVGTSSGAVGDAADVSTPEYFWFTDADIEHRPDTLRRLVVRTDEGQLDLASLMVLLRARTLPEKLLIPAFVYFFLQLYSPHWTGAKNARTAGAAGGCLLIRNSALRRIGGLGSIRNAMIDDCTLASAVKKSGGRLWLGVTRASVSLRDYARFAEIREMIARTAFTQLRYSAVLLLLTIVGLLFTYIAPVALLFAGHDATRVLGAVACCLMIGSYVPAVRYFRLSPAWALTLPLAALFYAHATMLSAVRFWRGQGGQWKGRAQASSAASATVAKRHEP